MTIKKQNHTQHNKLQNNHPKPTLETLKRATSKRRRLRKVKPPTAITVGVSQKFWNEHGAPTHCRILRFIGATDQQTEQLYVRDWLSLPLWVKKRVKRFNDLTRNAFSQKESEKTEEAA